MNMKDYTFGIMIHQTPYKRHVQDKLCDLIGLDGT